MVEAENGREEADISLCQATAQQEPAHSAVNVSKLLHYLFPPKGQNPKKLHMHSKAGLMKQASCKTMQIQLTRSRPEASVTETASGKELPQSNVDDILSTASLAVDFMPHDVAMC